jgi:hypothetical protein
MYLVTVDWAMSKASLSNSPWMRGAPHRGFSRLISRMRARSSCEIFGLPMRLLDRQRQFLRSMCRATPRAPSSSPTSAGMGAPDNMTSADSFYTASCESTISVPHELAVQFPPRRTR